MRWVLDAAARCVCRWFRGVVVSGYLFLLVLVAVAHFSEVRAYGFLRTAQVNLSLLRAQVASVEDQVNHFGAVEAYRLARLEERIGRLEDKLDIERRNIQQSTAWIVGSFVATLFAITSALAVYVVKSRGGREGE